jgi:hypothetical protein
MAKIKLGPTAIVNICMDNTQITIADLDTIKNIIDLACTRGAFRGAEISQVGAVYDKLSLFLQAVIAQAQAQESGKASITDSNTADISNPKGE